MSMFGIGASLGARHGLLLGEKLRKHLPKWAQVVLFILFVLTVLVLIGLLFYALEWERNYKRLQYTAHAILDEELIYYVENGTFTNRLNELEGKLPILLQEEYNKNDSTYKNGQKISSSHVYTTHTKKGDTVTVKFMDEKHSSSLDIDVSAKAGTLPASYTVRYFVELGENQNEKLPLLQCNVLSKNPFWGGNLCRRMGAKPTDDARIWLF